MRRILHLYRQAYSGLSPATWYLSFVMLVNRAGTMVVPFLSLYLTHERHESLTAAGLVMAVYGAGAICGGYLGGRLTDRFGFYRVQLASLAGGGLGYIALGQAHSLTAICAWTFAASLVNESFRPANSSAIARYSAPENRTRSYALNRLSINLGWAVGGSLGGVLAACNYQLLFWTDGLTNLAGVLLLLLLLKKPATAAAQAPDPGPEAGSDKPFHDRVYLRFLRLVVLFASCFFQLFTTFSVFCKDGLRMSEQQIGAIMAVNGLMIGLFEMVLVFRLEGRSHPQRTISLGHGVIAAAFLLLSLPAGYGFALALGSIVLTSFGEMLSMPFMNSFWVRRTNDRNRGSYAGLYTIAWALAQLAGPVAGARIAELYGFPVLWWTVGGACALSAVGFRMLGRK